MTTDPTASTWDILPDVLGPAFSAYGKTKRVKLWVDGASRGNPGPASWGVFIEHEGVPLAAGYGRLGIATCNQAEYQALIHGLAWCRDHGVAEVMAYTDSQLLANQMSGRWRMKSALLRPLWIEARKVSRGFRSFSIEWVPREENVRADRLTEIALDKVPLTRAEKQEWRRWGHRQHPNRDLGR